MSKNKKENRIDMDNKNALVSIAYVSQNANNPYSVFCEYIKYCIFSSPAELVSISEIKDNVGKEFGIYLPHHIILHCLSVLEKEGSIRTSKHLITRVGSYDIEAFERRRTEYRRAEAEILSKLCTFVSQYGKNWDEDYARSTLINVLDKQGLAFDVFLHENSIPQIPLGFTDSDEDLIALEDGTDQYDGPLFSDENLVGKFVQDILNGNSVQKDYLLRICEGLMICIGSYQLPSDGVTIAKTQIKGTCFIFDTRLLLRFVDCAGEAAASATKELVKLIQGAGGLIYYYPQTKEEMDRAFEDAIKSLSNGYPPRDNEMRLFASRIKNSIAVLSAKKANLSKELASANIYEKPLDNYTDKEILKYGFQIDALKNYMYRTLRWETKTIDNDALSIWETHMRRKGNYDDYFGSSKCLDVFVTSNAKLIQVSLGFKNEYPSLGSIQMWRQSRLPIITDVRLMCRLWTPAEQVERVSLLYLSANVVAAQRPTNRYIKRIRELAIELEERVPQYSGISLPAYFDDVISDAILKTTKGLEENLDLGSFASTINELTEWKAKEQEEKTQAAVSERDNLSSVLNEQTDSIISGAVEQFRNKLGWRRPVLWLAQNWVIVFTVVFAFVAAIVSSISGKWHIMWAIAIPAIVKAIELITTSKHIEKRIMKWLLPVIEQSYSKKVVSHLRKAEIEYKEEIVRRILSQTDIICKCREIIE